MCMVIKEANVIAQLSLDVSIMDQNYHWMYQLCIKFHLYFMKTRRIGAQIKGM